MNLKHGSLPQSKPSEVSGVTETNKKVPRTSPFFQFPRNLLGSLFSMSFIGSLFCLRPINFCIPFWTYFGSHSISSHFLAQSFLLTNLQSKYLCYNMSYWKNPQVLQNWTDLIRKIVSAVCSKPTQLCNLRANIKYKWPWLFHFNVWQNPLQIKKKKREREKKKCPSKDQQQKKKV